jgi:LysM repeat protein/ABC-type branched-subunit amino acid transport system substrate-binding protein
MNWLRRMIPLIFICCLFTCVSMAQGIQKSTQIEFIGGRNCYLHTVKAGQSLYSIARAYQVTEDDVLKLNPDAKKGIKVDQVLKIPVTDDNSKDVYMIHTVKEGETLSELAEQYNVKLSEIYQLNPGLTPAVKIGQKIKLPRPAKVAETVEPATFKFHVVQKNETLFSIAKQYGVTVDELKKNNPGLTEAIKLGQQIKVPDNKVIAQVEEKPKDTLIFDCGKSGLQKSYNIGLLIPFYTSQVYSIDTSNIDKSSKDLDPFTFIGFYEGFRIALDSLERSGFSAKVVVDDVTEGSDNTVEILNRSTYKDMDLLIGPFFGKNFQVAADWAKDKQVKIVNPFSSNSEFVAGNPYVMKNVASCTYEAKQTADYIRKTWPDANVFLVYSAYETDTSLRVEFQKALAIQESQPKAYFDVNYSKEGLAGISKDLSTDKPNIIISLFKSEVAISNYIRGMSSLSYSYPIVVFGPRKWDEISSLELDYLINIKLHVISNSFIDYHKAEVKDFVLHYRDKYSTEPDEYAFAGFDCAMYYLNALRLYGKDFQRCLHQYHPQMLETEMDFDHKEGCGYENKCISIYRYENYVPINAYTNPLTTVEINKKDK